ncbi:MAG: metallophosphoesterase [Oscillospiraceae bacterium]|nr:metallophosphoesterase [Oscillospiraceae bacterium]
MNAVVKKITPVGRILCISDIHGHVSLLNRLLEQTGYSPGKDTLILLGDLYTKGPDGPETLRRVIELTSAPNVHVLRGNCEDITEWMSPDEVSWVNALPHILDAGDYVFVHGGLPSEDLENLDEWACMKNDAFLEQGLTFSRWVVTGHWPVNNYGHRTHCCNPIVSGEQRVIAIDGGCGIKRSGQLNAFIIQDGAFSFSSIDDLPPYRVAKTQQAGGGTLNITWNDRFVDILSRGSEVSTVRHRATGRILEVPNSFLWERDGVWSTGDATDTRLPVEAGETVKLVSAFTDRVLAKKDGVVGWIFP